MYIYNLIINYKSKLGLSCKFLIALRKIKHEIQVNKEVIENKEEEEERKRGSYENKIKNLYFNHLKY